MSVRRALPWLAGVLALVLVCALGFVYWAVQREAGNAWLLRQIPGLAIEAPQGTLLGSFAARRVTLTLADGKSQIVIEGLRWQDASLAWRHLSITQLQADAVLLKLAPSDKPAAAPTSLVLPLQVDVDRARVGRIEQGSLHFSGLDAALSLGTQTHRVKLQALNWEQLRLSGEAQIGVQGALPVQLTLDAQGLTRDWRGHLTAHGPLALLQTQALLEDAGQHLQIDASLQAFAPWPFKALQAEVKDFDLRALSSALPRTRLSGQAQVQSSGWQAPATVQAELRNTAAGRWDEERLPVQSLRLVLQAQPDRPDDLLLQSLDARLPGGASVQGQGRLEPGQRWRLRLRLANLRPEALDKRAMPLLLNGTADLAGAPNAPISLTAHLSGANARADLEAALSPQRITVRHAELAAGAARAQMQGEAELAGQGWRAKAQGQVQDFDPHAFWAAAPQAALNAQVELELQADKAWPRGRAELKLLPSHWGAAAFEGQARYADGEVQAALSMAQARLEAQARLGGTPAAPTVDGQLHLTAPDLSVFDPFLGKQHMAGSGEAQLKLGLDAQGQLSFDGQATLKDGQLKGAVEAREVQAHLSLSGTPARHRLDFDLQGRLRPPTLGDKALLAGAAHLALEGGLKDGSWTARIARLQARPGDTRLPAWVDAQDLQLTLQLGADHAVSDASLAPGLIELGGARWRWSDLQWHAPRRAGGPPQIDAVLALEPLAVAPLLARWQPSFGWSGDLVVGAAVRLHSHEGVGLQALIERVSGDLAVVDESGRRQALGLSRMRLNLQAQQGRWLFTPELEGTGWGSLSGSVSARTAADALVPPGSAALGGELQAQVAQLGTWGALLPPGWRLGGSMSAGVNLSGSLGAPHVRGKMAGSGITLRNLLEGVDWSEGAFQLDFDGATAHLAQFSLRGGKGRIEASGSATLGEHPQAELQLKADHFGVLGRIDRMLVASGEAQMRLDAEALKLDGKLRVDEGLFDFSRSGAPTLGDDVYVLRPESPKLPPAPETASARKTQIAVAVDLGDALRLRGRGFESRLRGTLRLSQAGGKPSITGVVQTEGGLYAAYGQKLEIERGEIRFNGPYDNPQLDILALRANTDTRVGVLVSGTAQSPRVALYSDPDMSDTDKLAWLLLGHGSDSLGRTDTSLLQQAALALLAGEGQSSSDKVIKGLGLDELSVRQTDATSDGTTRDTIVHLGKQLSNRWYVGYERSINTTTGSWQLIYRIAQRFTLRAQTGDDNALELIWQWKWQ